MKAMRLILCLLCAAVVGLLLYQGLITKELTSSDLTRALLILAGLLLSFVRSFSNQRSRGSKTLFQKAYKEFIRNAFAEEPRLEKLFYSAVADYNQGKPDQAVDKLMNLRRECRNSDDIYAVTVFTALCLDDLQLYEEAANAYHNALKIHRNTTLASNLGLCYQRLGNFAQAQDAYELAIDIDPDNAFANNNYSAMYFREADYESALEYAQHALDINPKLPQALGTSAICFALLGQTEEYREYYRRAVAAGYDGQKIKQAIANLDPEL